MESKNFKREYIIKINANSETDCKEALLLIKKLLSKFSKSLEWKRPNKFHLMVESKLEIEKGKGCMYTKPLPLANKQW